MGRTSENVLGVIRIPKVQGGSGMKPGGGNHRRKALSAIDTNIIDVQKRGALTEKDAERSKKPTVSSHRPVTRGFAAQLACKEQPPPLHKEGKPVQPRDYIIIEDEDGKPTDVNDAPMLVEQSEATLEHTDRMDVEAGNEEIEETEPVVDIDNSDKNNPLAVTEYLDAIFAYYKKIESLNCVPPNYMSEQLDINERMRSILIDWLIEVHYKFELMDETLYLTVNLIDRYLAIRTIIRKKLQLVGVTAMFIACKYEELSVPVVEDLILISDKAYGRKEILDMEKLMINTVKFNMSVPTPYHFMKRFLKAAQADRTLELLSFFIIELCLMEYEMLRFPPSLQAAAAIFTAQCTISRCSHWSRTCQRYTNYTQEELLECAKLMVTFHQKAGTGKLTAVHKKYNTSRHGYAARTEPAVFLVDAVANSNP